MAQNNKREGKRDKSAQVSKDPRARHDPDEFSRGIHDEFRLGTRKTATPRLPKETGDAQQHEE